MNQNQVIEAIQAKYGISEADAKKVLAALAAAEQQRRTSTGGDIPGMRGAVRTQRGDLGDIMGSLLGGQSSGGGMGELGGIIGALLGGPSGGGQSSGADLIGIVTDLIGGATNNPNQGGSGVDLGGIIGGLLGGSGGQNANDDDDLMGLIGSLLGGSGGQGSNAGGAGDLFGMIGGLLGGMGGQPPPSPTHSQGANQPGFGSPAQSTPTSNPGKPDKGSIADHLKPSQINPNKLTKSGRKGLTKRDPKSGGTKGGGEKSSR